MIADERKTMVVAVVDDEPMERKRLAAYIKAAGWQSVDCFASGDEFLKGFNDKKYGLVFMDILMDGRNGVEIVKVIRKASPRIFIAFVTGSTDFAMEAYRLHVNRYIEKPFVLSSTSVALIPFTEFTIFLVMIVVDKITIKEYKTSRNKITSVEITDLKLKPNKVNELLDYTNRNMVDKIIGTGVYKASISTMKHEKDALEIYVDEDKIILKKYHPACIFCNDARDVIRYKDKLICKNCLEQLKKEL